MARCVPPNIHAVCMWQHCCSHPVLLACRSSTSYTQTTADSFCQCGVPPSGTNQCSILNYVSSLCLCLSVFSLCVLRLLSSNTASPFSLGGLYCTVVLYCSIVLYCIVLYCIVLFCIALHCIALHCIALYCIVLCCIVLHRIVLHCNVLYCNVLYCVYPCSRCSVEEQILGEVL